MREILEHAVQRLGDAYSKLKHGVDTAKDELGKDGVIQRFEFTFELLWKTLKIFLEYEGIDVKSPRESLKEAFRVGFIEDEETCLDMRNYRMKYIRESNPVMFSSQKKY